MRRVSGCLLAIAAALQAVLAMAGQGEGLPWKDVASGVAHAHIERPAPGGGTWNINLLRIDLSEARLDVVRARDRAIGLETTSAIARRLGAIAAVNGGYFKNGAGFDGDSTGTLQIDGVLLSEPDRGRASVGIVQSGGAPRLIFGHVVWRAMVDVDGSTRPIDGINRARGRDDLVLFNPQIGPAPPTDATGIEVAVENGAVTGIRDLAGGTPIPRDGIVLSARGAGAAWLRQVARPGARVRITMSLRGTPDQAGTRWDTAEDILAAGPRLVTAGRVDITDVREKMTPAFRTDLHPRTAIAASADGRPLLVVVDGRHTPERVGISLDDLARLLIDLGARDAINLDGGGSTTMVVNGAIVNYPSDPIGERPVSDALVVLRK